MKEQVYVKLAKIEQMKYHVSLFNSLITKKLDFYSIKKKINFLTYEITLSSIMHIYFVISMIHLKQVRTDSFEREISKIMSHELIIMNDHEKYIVKKILKTKKRDDKSNYIIKWRNYIEKIWKSKNQLKQNVSKLIKKFHRSRRNRDWEQSK